MSSPASRSAGRGPGSGVPCLTDDSPQTCHAPSRNDALWGSSVPRVVSCQGLWERLRNGFFHTGMALLLTTMLQGRVPPLGPLF